MIPIKDMRAVDTWYGFQFATPRAEMQRSSGGSRGGNDLPSPRPSQLQLIHFLKRTHHPPPTTLIPPPPPLATHHPPPTTPSTNNAVDLIVAGKRARFGYLTSQLRLHSNLINF